MAKRQIGRRTGKQFLDDTPVIGRYIPTMQPSYATPEETMQAHGGKTYADVKYDGYRVQVHKSKAGIVVYTRNENELNYPCYPDVMRVAENLPLGIFEAELVGKGASHKEMFDNTRKRFRRQGIKDEAVQRYLQSGIVNQTPLSLRVFDVLRFEDTGLLSVPLEQRRTYVEKVDLPSIQPAETELVTGVEALEALITQTFKAKQEGRVCKNPASLYLSGQQTIDWVKFKRSEPLDLVIVGFYRNEGYANGLPFTSVLCATYNDVTGMYETIGKIGVTRNGLAAQIYAEVASSMAEWRSKKVAFSQKLEREAFAQYVPDQFIDPDRSVVLEVKAMNLNYTDNWQTCGFDGERAFSMRIGFAGELRYDKSPKQATKTSIVRKLYELQEGQNR